jgi:hypothetical protein
LSVKYAVMTNASPGRTLTTTHKYFGPTSVWAKVPIVESRLGIADRFNDEVGRRDGKIDVLAKRTMSTCRRMWFQRSADLAWTSR